MIAPLPQEVAAYLEPVGDHELMRAQLLARAGDLLELASTGTNYTEVVFAPGSLPLFATFIKESRKLKSAKHSPVRVSFLSPEITTRCKFGMQLSEPYRLNADPSYQRSLFGSNFVVADLVEPDKPNMEFVRASLLDRGLQTGENTVRSFSAFTNNDSLAQDTIDGAYKIPNAEIFCGLGKTSGIQDKAVSALEIAALPFALKNPVLEQEAIKIFTQLPRSAAEYDRALRKNSLLENGSNKALVDCLTFLLERRTPRIMHKVLHQFHEAVLLGSKGFTYTLNGEVYS